MAMTDQSARSAHSVRASMKYTAPGHTTVFKPTEKGGTVWATEDHDVTIEDMRPIAGELSLDRNGFVLLKHVTKVKDCYDAEEVKRVFYPEVVDIMKKLTGATEVVVFGDIARDSSGRLQAKDWRSVATYGAHIDFSRETAFNLARQVLGEEKFERWSKHRFMLCNLWRPITTIKTAPFALIDASTVSQGDINISEVHLGERTSYGYNLSYSPRHKWYYVPDMRPDEIFVFRLFDSDPSKAQLTGHSAFVDPTAAPDAPPRQSLDIRALAVLPD